MIVRGRWYSRRVQRRNIRDIASQSLSWRAAFGFWVHTAEQYCLVESVILPAPPIGITYRLIMDVIDRTIRQRENVEGRGVVDDSLG